MLAGLGWPATGASAASQFNPLPDYPIPDGHYYTQASGQGIEAGFSITDDGGIHFFDEFVRLGGTQTLGYPSSQRFAFGGFMSQSTQKELLQWRPDQSQAVFANIFDVFTQRGLDQTLAQTRLIPPTEDNSPDNGLTWPNVVARHLALLDGNPAIRARYFADPDPVDDFGLPQGAADFGGVYVIRCERAAFQNWRIATSFARPGDVTQVNAGDLAKEFGIIPTAAASPEPASGELIAPPGAAIRPDLSTTGAARRSAASAMPSLVRIDVTLPQASGVASGIVLDAAGDVLTNEHVVDSATSIQVTYASGVSLNASVVGADFVDDLAVVHPSSSSLGRGVKAALLTGGAGLESGQFVVALGHTPYFAASPATRLGVFQRAIPDTVTILSSDTFILPGDSGGMLLDLSGNVVGVIDEIRFTDQAQQPLIGYAIDAGDASQIAQRILGGV